MLTLLFQLRAGIPSNVFFLGFPTKILCAFIVSPVHGTRRAHFVVFDYQPNTRLSAQSFDNNKYNNNNHNNNKTKEMDRRAMANN
jgi:hypothetical protein